MNFDIIMNALASIKVAEQILENLERDGIQLPAALVTAIHEAADKSDVAQHHLVGNI